MKKLKYEKPEVEVELFDPELDIITVSEGNGGGEEGELPFSLLEENF